MDFSALLRDAELGLPTEPRELYEQLPKKQEGWGYLRDVQAQILTRWHEVRDTRDIVVKVNTGGGKTIDGLVMLQSYLNEGIAPALYVAPDSYLVSQVISEAEHLGIQAVTDPEDSRYFSGEAIAVVTAAKLFNGRSVFSDNRPTSQRVPIGAVVIDDAHAILSILRGQMSLEIPRKNATFDQLLNLFEDDLKEQSPDALLDIREATGGGFVRVPFWAVNSKIDALRGILRAHSPANTSDFSWDAIREVLELCRIVFTRSAITIVPPCPPIQRVSSYVEAKRRIFLTATLANDSSLVTDFGVEPDLARAPIQPLTAGDIGERLILAPQEINPSISAEDIRAAVHELSKSQNTLVIVPSDKAMDRWDGLADARADKSNMKQTVANMKAGHVGLVVMANKYDGIDLPQRACRILVLDGLPESFSGDERLEALLAKSAAGIDDRQVQRLEQGMGRAVRSNEDHCVVFLIGKRLAQLTVDPRTLERFSPATQAQLKASRTVARTMDNTPLSKIVETARQALDRDESWVTFAKRALRGIDPGLARVEESAPALRRSFDDAVAGDLHGAAEQLAVAAEACVDPRLAGQLLEQQAVYIGRYDPATAQSVLAVARAKNPYVVRPLSGLTFRPISYLGAQADKMSTRLTRMFGTPAHMRVGIEGVLERLAFDPTAVEEFEEALMELGLFLGIGSQRPERELGNGPDNLWAIESGRYWVIEAKSGATSEFVGKRDAAQLGAALQWFGNKYPVDQAATPVMIHHSRKLYSDATAPTGMRVLNMRAMGELSASVRSLSEGLAAEGWNDLGRVAALIEGNRLHPDGLTARLIAPTGGTS
ncbi:helicase C-terminal domain-containing protein [Cryobacterium arcticum]|uniref:Helicase ATP-binding domain-containing protein n=1 Tax=Cryobacterium arcticum TaxID=670052 RepID=A0A317ZQI7_9MICO|nr:helicase C-terminal domain-containing protein [Cryobacterium arcticum]PXA68762.1 hypothetical protein CTB96_09845 [Cryobacterium arcticum]